MSYRVLELVIRSRLVGLRLKAVRNSVILSLTRVDAC